MKRTVGIAAITVFLVFSLFLSSCSPVDKNYGVESDESTVSSTVKKTVENVKHPEIMSSDRIMSKFVDISLFDEENYSEVYLGKKFDFNVTYAGKELTVPTTLSALNKAGWQLVKSNQYDENSLIYACETAEMFFQNEQGIKIDALFYNSSKSSVKLKKCRIVKFKINNDFYTNPDKYTEFSVNGVNNRMAVTDIIDTLGTPSHFYGNSEKDYYLDYFISEKDRRNGITVYINPADDLVTAVEFSYYK